MNRIGAIMKHGMASRLVAGAWVVPLLAAYFFVGGCGPGKRGLVLHVQAWGIAVTAAYCSA
jgi:hypothetical protein